MASDTSRVELACVRPAGGDGGAARGRRVLEHVCGHLQSRAAAGPYDAAEHRDTATLNILQERKKANGAVERGRGLADGMAGREDERPPPGRMVAPVTVSCRATFLVFLIHQRVDAGLLWRFPGGTRGCEPPPSSRSERSRYPLCTAGSRGPRAHAGGGVASRCGTDALRLFLEQCSRTRGQE